MGMDFLEIQPNGRVDHDYEFIKRYAEKNDFPVTYGSDWHGFTFDRAFLGRGENVMSDYLIETLYSGYLNLGLKLEEVCC